MNQVRTVTAVVAMAGLLATGVTFAQGPRGGGPDGRGGRGMGPGAGPGLALRGADLNDAQRQQIQEIRERYREQGREAASALAEAQQAQRDAVEAVPANEGLIISLTEQLVRTQIDVALHQARMNTEVWAVLTPAQQEQVAAARAEREARAGERRTRMAERRQQRP